MIDTIAQIFADNPESALDILEWGCFGSGILIGFFFGFLAIGLFNLFAFTLDWFEDRRAKKSGKLTNKQRLELLEQKIDSIADIVISSSEEVK